MLQIIFICSVFLWTSITKSIKYVLMNDLTWKSDHILVKEKLQHNFIVLMIFFDCPSFIWCCGLKQALMVRRQRSKTGSCPPCFSWGVTSVQYFSFVNPCYGVTALRSGCAHRAQYWHSFIGRDMMNTIPVMLFLSESWTDKIRVPWPSLQPLLMSPTLPGRVSGQRQSRFLSLISD